MGLLNKVLNTFGWEYRGLIEGKYVFGPRPLSKKSYNAGKTNRLTGNWGASGLTEDAELRGSLAAMVRRSRELDHNNDYVKGYFEKLKINVVGSTGILLQMNVVEDNGDKDTGANQIIEKAWKEWNKKEHSSMSGKESFRDLCCLAVESLARDGEAFFQKVVNTSSKFHFSLHPIESDYLDIELNKRLSNGNVIRLGIEMDQWNKPIAYWFLRKHPGDIIEGDYSRSEKHIRISANQIYHLRIKKRGTQNRGVPWAHASMNRLNNAQGYEENELIASRVASGKMGFFSSEDGEGYKGDGVDADGNSITEVEPGAFEKLPHGVKFIPFDPQHPTSQVPEFMKIMLRGASAGLGVSYNTFASDYTDINYSSLRQARLDDRDYYKFIQAFIVDHLCNDVFQDWLDRQFLTGEVAPLPVSKFEKFNKPKWRTRGWSWVDPKKDAEANSEAIKAGKTLQEIAAEQGRDWEDDLDQQAVEKAKAEKLGLDHIFQNSKSKESKADDNEKD